MDSKMRESLDRHITGNYGEDQLNENLAAALLEDNVNPQEDETLKTLSRAYREVYDEVESLDEQLKKLKRTKRNLQEQIYDAMIARGLEGMSMDVGSFRPKLTEKVSIIPDKKEEFFLYLEEIGLGGLIKREVHWQTLNASYRNGELADLPEDCVKEWSEKTVVMRRKK